MLEFLMLYKPAIETVTGILIILIVVISYVQDYLRMKQIKLLEKVIEEKEATIALLTNTNNNLSNHLTNSQ